MNNKHKLPNLAPIHKDPDRFALVKKLWNTLIQKKCSIKSMHTFAKEIHLTSSSNKPLSLSKMHELFRNPFYYGHFKWKGNLYHGNHKPMISKTQFDEVQTILDGRSFTCSKTHSFAYTGLIRCGECGAAITAEEKTKYQKNGNIHHYTYYHCTKRIKKCSQKPVRVESLEQEIADTLNKINIPSSFHKWAIKQLKAEQAVENQDQKEITSGYRKSLDSCVRKIEALFDLRLSGEVNSEEFTHHKKKLLQEKHKYDELINDATNRVETWLDRAEQMLNFSETAKNRFELGTLEDKRDILATLGSNLSLLDRKLSISLAKPLELMEQVAPEVQALHNRLEPLYPIENTAVYEEFYAENEKWGG